MVNRFGTKVGTGLHQRGAWMRGVRRSLGAVVLSSLALNAHTAEQAIRKAFAEKLPALESIDEIRQTAMPGLWEVRIGSSILYSDQSGRFVFQGELIDLQQGLNLTKQRLDGLIAFEFDKLPLADAIVWQQGDGSRKLAVFADPNCGYCKRFEQALSSVTNITVYTFLLPILGDDSVQKSRSILCAKDPVAAWRNWMVNNVPLAQAEPEGCDASSLQRNLALSEKHAVAVTPMLVFADNVRVPGALPKEELEKYLAQAQAVGAL